MPRVATLFLAPLARLSSPQADDRHLSEAQDHADLERRLRRLERGRDERFASLQEWAP